MPQQQETSNISQDDLEAGTPDKHFSKENEPHHPSTTLWRTPQGALAYNPIIKSSSIPSSV